MIQRHLSAILVVAIMITGAIPIIHFAAADNDNNSSWDNKTSDPHCTTTVNGENVAGNAVQTAINHANSGDTICLEAGTYPENVTITQPLTLEGIGYTIHDGNSYGSPVAILEPTTLATQTTDVDTSFPLDPIILVKGGATGVTIKNLEVNGSIIGSKLTSCGDANNPEPIGIMFQSASGTINDVISVDVESNQSLFGCQTDAGLGIFVQTGSGHNSDVSIKDSNVTNYQKNGITCNDAGTSCSVSNDHVAGIGQTPLTAQNGVQIAFGATGTIQNSQISGDSYTGVTECPDENYFAPGCYQAAGILLYDGPGVAISNNKVSSSDIGIAIAGLGDLHNANVNATGNTLVKNYGYGIVYDSFNGTSQNNFFNGNQVGLLVTDYSSNANVTSINDHFTNNIVNNEALGAPGSKWFADLAVETSWHHEYISDGLHHSSHFHER